MRVFALRHVFEVPCKQSVCKATPLALCCVVACVQETWRSAGCRRSLRSILKGDEEVLELQHKLCA